MEAFAYRDGALYCEGVALAEIAEAVGGPVYVYSLDELGRRYGAYAAAFPQAGKGVLHMDLPDQLHPITQLGEEFFAAFCPIYRVAQSRQVGRHIVENGFQAGERLKG